MQLFEETNALTALPCTTCQLLRLCKYAAKSKYLCVYTLLETNISATTELSKMMFLFPRWDTLVPWRVRLLNDGGKLRISDQAPGSAETRISGQALTRYGYHIYHPMVNLNILKPNLTIPNQSRNIHKWSNGDLCGHVWILLKKWDPPLKGVYTKLSDKPRIAKQHFTMKIMKFSNGWRGINMYQLYLPVVGGFNPFEKH